MKRFLLFFAFTLGIGLGFLFAHPGTVAAAGGSVDLKDQQDGVWIDGPVTVDGIQWNSNQALPTAYQMSVSWDADLASQPITGTCTGTISYNSWLQHNVGTPWGQGAGVRYPFSSPNGQVHQEVSFNINLYRAATTSAPGGWRVDFQISCRANGSINAPSVDVVSMVFTSQQSHPKIDTFTLNGRPGDVDTAIKMPNTGAYTGTLTLGWAVRQTSLCVPYIQESNPSELVLDSWGWGSPLVNGDPRTTTTSTFVIHVPANQLPYGTAAIVNYGFTCYNDQGRSTTRYVALHLSRQPVGQSAGCATQITDVYFVIDDSSSMDEPLSDFSSKRLANIQAMADFRASMRAKSLPVRYSTIDFSGGADFSKVKFQGVSQTSQYGVYQPADNAGGPSTNPNSGTCIGCAVNAVRSAFTEQYRAANKDTNPKLVVLLTDGLITIVWDGARFPQNGQGGYGIPQNAVQPNGPVSLLAAENQTKQFAVQLAHDYPSLTFFTVGLGLSGEVDAPFLKSIARITHPANDDYSLISTSYSGGPGVGLRWFYLTELPQATQQSTPVTISGSLFRDDNRDGVQDNGEVLIDGTNPARTVTVISTTDPTNRLDAPVSAGGQYTATMGCPDEYKISQSLPSGWDQTLPVGAPGYYQEYVNQNIVRDFGSTTQPNPPVPPVVNGTVYYDANGDGVMDNGETGIANQTVILEMANGTPTTTQAVTGPDGVYSMTFPNTLTWTDAFIVAQAPPPSGYIYGNPASGAFPPTVYPPGTTIRDFADVQQITSSSVGGTVFNDENSDGLRGGSEAGIAGVQLTLIDANGVAKGSAMTGQDGSYQINLTNQPAGVLYTLQVDLPNGFIYTIPSNGQYTNLLLDPGTSLTKDFGMHTVTTGGSYGQFCR